MNLNGNTNGSKPHTTDIPQSADDKHDLIGDLHLPTSIETPLREDAFALSDAEKEARIEEYFAKIMETLGLDLTDDSLQGTPHRVAKMYVRELFYGLDPNKKPRVATFDNRYNYDKMLIEKNITFRSACEHHFMPIMGTAHVGYISTGRVIGLSKINRIVDYYARRPQVQERMARQVLHEMQHHLETESVAVVLDAKHTCVSHRGVQDDNSSTITIEYGGRFAEPELRREFMDYIGGTFLHQ